MIEYLDLLYQTNKLHTIAFPLEEHFVEIPQLLSQYIAITLLGLSEYSGKGKTFDAEKTINGILYYYEIKATSSLKGATSINYKKRSNVLVWVYVDVVNQKVFVRQRMGFDLIKSKKELYNGNPTKLTNLVNPLKRKNPFSTTMSNIKWDSTVISFDFASPPSQFI